MSTADQPSSGVGGAVPAGHRVVFTPSGLSGIAVDGDTVLDAARSLGIDLDSVCGGRQVCGRCQVTAPTGTFSKWNITTTPDALDVPTGDIRTARPLIAGQVLGCAAKICGDVVIDVPPASQVHRPVVRKDLDDRTFDVDPRLRLLPIEVATPTDIDAAETAVSLINDALKSQPTLTGTNDLTVELTDVPAHLLPQLQPAIDQGKGTVTVAVAADTPHRLAAIWPGVVDTTYGIAVDVGSTTVAAHLVDLSAGASIASQGVMNPQIRFGEDLMSRVSYVMMNPGSVADLTDAVRAAVTTLIADLVDAARLDPNRPDGVEIDPVHITEVVLVGNPIMHHLLLGIDPTPLGQAPFTLATNLPVTTTATDLGWSLPNAAVYVGPCIAGHVGADTAAAILADGPHRSDGWRLLVDVGTNAEIVLGNTTTVYAASSPTGPAFEGAQISSGQRATHGAIERVRIDPTTGIPRFRVIGVDAWSDDPTFAATVDPANGGPGVTGICGSGIIEVIAEMYLAGLIDADGVIVGIDDAPEGAPIIADGRTNSLVLWSNPQIVITQPDVRAVQLAKAALRAGIELLIDHAGATSIDHIALAGAFGAHIDPVHAMVLGLIPDAPIDAVTSVGNAAGVGAVEALVSRHARAEMETTAAKVIKVETATEPTFQQRFVDAMALPHANAPTDHLAAVVTLPERTPSTSTGQRRGRGDRGRRRGRTTSASGPGDTGTTTTSGAPI